MDKIDIEKYEKTRIDAVRRLLYNHRISRDDVETASYHTLGKMFKGEEVKIETIDTVYRDLTERTNEKIEVYEDNFEEVSQRLLSEMEKWRNERNIKVAPFTRIVGIESSAYYSAIKGGCCTARKIMEAYNTLQRKKELL